MSTPLYLLKTRRFAPLFTVQFLGAFNDNLFKNTFAVLLTFQAAQWTALPMVLLAPLIGAVFIFPFFLLSGLAGEVADSYDKAWLARIVKVWEIVLMVVATVGFATNSFPLLLIVVFGMGVHSTLFGPIKYSIIPQHMGENELISANALVEAGTFVAILLGTILGGVLAGIANGGVIAGGVGLVIALIGYGASRAIPPAPALASESISLNLVSQTINTLKLAYRNKRVFLSILAISWFWLYGALLLSQFPAFVKMVLMGNESTVSLLLAFFTLGIAGGSMVCNALSHHTIRPSLIVVGAIGMAIVGVDFAFNAYTFHTNGSLYDNTQFYRIVADLILIGGFGGLYSVPLYTLMQRLSEESVRSRIIAANNILNALFMVAGAVWVMVMLENGFVIADMFLYVALATAAVAALGVWVILRLR